MSEAPEGNAAFRKEGTVREIEINGYTVHVIEKQNPTQFEVNWGTDDRFITINTHYMTWDETQSLIESFRRIIREDQ